MSFPAKNFSKEGPLDAPQRPTDLRLWMVHGRCAVCAGLAALIFSCWSRYTAARDWDRPGTGTSRYTAARDWDGAEVKGRVAMYLSIAGIVISIVVLVIAVLFLFTKDT